MAALTLLASVLNYASSVIFSRVLDPVGFGDLTSLMALAVLIAVPTGAAQTVVAERVAFHAAGGRGDRVRYLVRHAAGHVTAVAVAITVVYTLCIPLVVDLLNLRVAGPAIALAAVIFFGFISPLALGVMQGLDRFVAYGLLLVAISLARIVFGVGWAVLAGGGAGGALAGQALGMAGVIVLSAWMLRDVLMKRGTGAAKSGIMRKPDLRAVTASAAFVAFAVISNLDLLLAKLFLTGHEAGIYAAIATVGKIVTFLPAAIAVAMVPNAARANHAEGESQRVLRLSAMLVGATAALAALPILIVPDLVVSLMFGGGYEDAAKGLLPIVLAGAALAMLNLLVVYSVAIRDQRWPLLLLAGVAIQVVGFSLFHSSPVEVAYVQAVATVAVLSLNELFSHSLIFKRRRAA
jgi:O-antigen/teichoic acid export membrane protein